MNEVKEYEFKIYYSFLNKNDLSDEKFIQNNLDILLSDKKYPLLPLALIFNNKCIENTNEYYAKRFDLSICKNIKYNDIINFDKSKIYYNEDGLKIFEYNGKHYIFDKFENKDVWLLANIKDYYKFNDYQSFFKFITTGNEGLSWLSSFKSIELFLKKSRFIWTILVPFSAILYLIFTFYYLKQSQKNRKLVEEKNKYINEWDDLNSSIKKLINEQITLEKELNEKSELELKNDLLNEEITKLNVRNQQLIDSIEFHKNKLREIEKIEDNISIKINNTSKNLTALEKEKLLDESLNKLNQIDLLWKYNPTWQERYIIENNVSLRDEFTPFTISQAFMCFEKIIENLVLKNDESKKDLTLIDQINFIFEKELLPLRFKNDLHLIRKARNKWFHNGLQPKKEVFDILLDILDKTRTTPLL
ncbi:hypothetical protein [Aliarcobacter butzleri]|nr:hypothetical protein [Aliarcobacter butzleri]